MALRPCCGLACHGSYSRKVCPIGRWRLSGCRLVDPYDFEESGGTVPNGRRT